MPRRRPRPPSEEEGPTLTPPRPGRRASRTAILGAAASVVLLAVLAWAGWRALDRGADPAAGPGDPSGAPAAAFVGAATCAGCHAEQFAAWQGSQHSLAMQPATEAAVLGDFDDARFSHAGVETTFFRRGARFMVRTEGPDGRPGEFEVKYTFGVAPLQQYLVELPDGRVQPLQVSWDSRPRERGGQRWFHLYPGDRIEHTDELHWTGAQQNWNFMCADCHSTDVQKGYDADADTFRTTWSEINVACEACHGPGSRHLEWAREGRAGAADGDLGLTARLDEREGVRWTIDPASGVPRRSRPRDSVREIEVCAQCHSRRAQIAEEYVAGAPFGDHYLPSALMPGLYHPDGQQLDEVYTYGSFLQSRMFAAGVTCSDCHDPHTQKLRAAGNQLCTQCHTAPTYEAPTHHFHPAGSPGAQCVSCHMPTETYMRIDPRRDHSIRVPRPDLSVKLGVPNACTGCHQDRSAGWAAERVRKWYGRDASGFQRFAEEFHAAERGTAGADSGLAAIAVDRSHPGIVRASAVARLAELPSVVALEVARASVADADPWVRHAGLRIVESLPPRERIALAAPLLSDRTRAVRIQAAWVLAPASRELPAPGYQSAFARAADEFIATQRLHADRAENLTSLGTFLGYQGRLAEAESSYQAAIRLQRAFVPAYVNLADLYRAQGREADAERVLRSGLEAAPRTAALHHSLGLALARTGRSAEAVEELSRAAGLAPEDPTYGYAYGVALHSSGRAAEAIRTLEGVLQRHPRNPDILFALATFHRDAGRRERAVHYARLMAEARPGDEQARALLASLGQAPEPGGATIRP